MARPDTVQVFETYLTFGGDAPRTALACGLTRQELQGMVNAGGWDAKVKDWTTIKEGSTADESVKISRAVSFVQAHRLRGLVDKVVTKLSALEPDELMDLMCSKTRRDGETLTTFSAKPLAELCKAAELAQGMAARALGDTTAERPTEQGNAKGSSIALLVQQAMTAADSLGVSSLEVVKEQLKLPTKHEPAPLDVRTAP